MKRITLNLLLAVALCVGLSTSAMAQDWNVSPGAGGAVGDIVPCFNTIDSVIVDGTVVSIDTTATTKRFGIRPYTVALGGIGRIRCVGIAVGNIPKSSQGGVGRILLRGYHPRARVAISNAAAGNQLKISTTVAHSLAVGDTVQGNIGIILGGNSTVFTGPTYKYKVWIWGFGPQSSVLL